MSASVWFEEVNIGLLKEIESYVRIKDQKGVLIPLPKPEKSIVVRKPEEDFKFEVFPCVSIYNKDYVYAPIRHCQPDPVVVDYDRDNGNVVLEDKAVPFNLSYQIDFWARYQEDMDCMTRTWLMRHHHQFNLDVIDDGGTPRSVNVLAEGRIVKSDLVQNKERLFHSIANYTIWVEIDDETRYTVPMVRTVDVDAKQYGS